MTAINKLSLEELVRLQDRIAEEVRGCKTFESAAQRYMSILYEELVDSVVLARLFATVPYGELPASIQVFSKDLARSANIHNDLDEETLVLSLLGTRGFEHVWNERHASREHSGIPLISSEFIDRIPMMSRLLKQLGAGIDWIDQNDTKLVARTVGKLSGVFHVEDAASEVDSNGRKIISEQSFVDRYRIKTVFGIGGCYLGTSVFFTTILFCREQVCVEIAQRFMLQANKFKTATLSIVDSGKIFD